MNKQSCTYNLYLVMDERFTDDHHALHVLEEALKGGVSIVQLREKQTTTRAFTQKARKVHELTRRYDVPLIINDRVDVALAIGAEGVHLGQEDLSLADARKIAGTDMLIGASVATLNEALVAESEGADYLGVGALFPTSTKSNTRPVTIENLKRIKNSVKVPVVAIGGIHLENLPSVIRCEVDGVAVVSAIFGVSEPLEATKRLIDTIEGTRRHLL